MHLFFSNKKIYSLILLILIILIGIKTASWACTTLIVGKNTTKDGSILFAKTEDDSAGDVDYLWYIPAQKHPAGTMLKLRGGGEIPQVLWTYGYFWDQCPGTEYSNALVNEYGIALGSDACSSREDSLEELEKRGDIVDGGIGWRLRFILAERCKTAREAVELAAKLLDHYGYRGSGRNLSIVGPKEAWILQMARGKHYVARKVGDDEAVPIPNTFTIRDVDLNDKSRFICPPDLVDYAVKRGWHDPEKDGVFDFAKAYSNPEALLSKENTRRAWMVAKMVNRYFPLTWQEADQGLMPVALKPDRKLTVKDMLTILRNHFEGTDLDTSQDYTISPHKNENRPVCVYHSHRTTVVQQRAWMPVAIGTLVWRALYPPCSSGFVPWYLGVRDIPQAFQKAPENLRSTRKSLYDFHFNESEAFHQIDMDSASCVFGVMAGLIDVDYKNVIQYVQHQWQQFEAFQFEVQPDIENMTLKLYSKDKNEAIRFLSSYTHSRAAKSLAIARSLINTLQQRLWKAQQGTKLHFKIELSPDELKEYEGTYRYTYQNEVRQCKIEVSNRNIYFISRTGDYNLIHPQSKELFFFDEFAGELIFEKNENNTVNKCWLCFGDIKIPATKIE
jgi:dipeptidase